MGIALAVGMVLFGFGSAVLAAQFHWKGNASAQNLWTVAGDWCGGAVPSGNDAAVYLSLNPSGCASPSSMCILDTTSTTTVEDMIITGDSPTKMTFNVRDVDLNVTDLDLNDYADLDADQDLIVSGGTSMAGDIWVNADGDVWTGLLTIDGSQTRLYLTASSATFVVHDLVIDANAANAPLTFKLNGGVLDLGDNSNDIIVKSDLDEDNKRAKLWLNTGEFNFGNFSAMVITGGVGSVRRAELDLDEDVILNNNGVVYMTGDVAVDIAANKTFHTEKLIIEGPSVVRVNAGSGAKLETGTE